MRQYNYRFLVLIIFISSCADSRLTKSWISKDVDFTTYKSFLVIAIVNNQDRFLKSLMEKSVSKNLGSLGYISLIAEDSLKPDSWVSGISQNILQYGGRSTMDAVLTISLVTEDREQRLIQTQIYPSAAGLTFYRFFGYDIGSASPVYGPGYFVSYSNFHWVGNLYDLRAGQLIYTANIRSSNQPDEQVMAFIVGKLMIKKMASQHLLRLQAPLKPF